MAFVTTLMGPAGSFNSRSGGQRAASLRQGPLELSRSLGAGPDVLRRLRQTANLGAMSSKSVRARHFSLNFNASWDARSARCTFLRRPQPCMATATQQMAQKVQYSMPPTFHSHLPLL